MPLPRAVPFVGQQNDPTGCWFACAHMLRKYYEGGNAVPQRMPELENEDGTHQRMDSSSMAKFLTNEKLEPLSGLIPRTTASEIDGVLTQFGPVIFSWSGGVHVSVIIGTMNQDVSYHDPAKGANLLMSAAEFKVRQMGGLGGTVAMLIRNPKLTAGRRQVGSIPSQLVIVGEGEMKKYPMKWPTGWWRVFDGGTWYYYLADGGVAMSSRSPPPAGSLGPPAKAHNTGKWHFTAPKTLVIRWKQVVGAKTFCEETFHNATEECEKMNATSTLYCPLEAKRHRG